MECRPHWEFFFLVHSKSDYMEFWGKKWACTPFCHADSLLACYATSQIFIEHMLIFSLPPPPSSFLKLFSFVNNFLVLFFKPLFFFICDPIKEVLGQKILPVGPSLYDVKQILFWLVTHNF